MKRFIRRIHWAIAKKVLIAKISAVDSILSYPMIMWLTFGEAGEKFLEVGGKGFETIYNAKLEELVAKLTAEFLPDHLKPTNERYWSKTQTIARISTMNKQEQEERDNVVRAMEEKLAKATFSNGEASLN